MAISASDARKAGSYAVDHKNRTPESIPRESPRDVLYQNKDTNSERNGKEPALKKMKEKILKNNKEDPG